MTGAVPVRARGLAPSSLCRDRTMSTADPACAAPIEVAVDLELDDLVHASYALFLRRARFVLALHGLLVLTGVAVAVAYGGEFTGNPALVLFGVVLLLALPGVALGLVYWSAASQFERGAPLAATMRYRFSPTALEIGSKIRSGRLPWEAISEAFETKRSFLLFLSPGEHYVVPKRCFPNCFDVDRLRELLREQVASKTRLLL